MQEIQSDDSQTCSFQNAEVQWHYCTFAQCLFSFHSYSLGVAGKKSSKSVSQNTVVWEVSLCLVQPLKNIYGQLLVITSTSAFYMCKQMVFDIDSGLMLELKGNIVNQHQRGEGRTTIHLHRNAESSTIYCTLICATSDFWENKKFWKLLQEA